MALTNVHEVAAMLRWSTAEEAKHAAQVAVYVAAAISLVEDDAGPFTARTATYTADGGASVALPHKPNTVTSVTVGGTAVTGYTTDLNAGIIYGPFTSGRQNVVVTYTVGNAVIPEAVKLATTMIAVDKWAIASQRGPGLDEQVDTSYLMPKAARDLLAQFKRTQPAGFA